MILEYPSIPKSDVLSQFAQLFQAKLFRGRLVIPEAFGRGSISYAEIEPGFSLTVHNYTLNSTFKVRRSPFDDDDVIIVFNMGDLSSYTTSHSIEKKPTAVNGRSIFIESASLEAVITFESHIQIRFVKIKINRRVLDSLLNIRNPNATIRQILSGDGAFLFIEEISPENTKILSQLLALNELDDLSPLYFKVKGQELLYNLFLRLQKRECITQTAINSADVNRLFLVRAMVLSDLSKPPVIATLASSASMSESKLMKLFKQVFGDTIYDYFQKYRMEQAAFFLKQNNISVSEVGYKLGFTNLSHFGRLFERYYGLPPKKYATTG